MAKHGLVLMAFEATRDMYTTRNPTWDRRPERKRAWNGMRASNRNPGGFGNDVSVCGRSAAQEDGRRWIRQGERASPSREHLELLVGSKAPLYAGLWRGRAVMEVPTRCRSVGSPSSPVPMLRPGSGGCSDKTESDGIWTCFKHGWAPRQGLGSYNAEKPIAIEGRVGYLATKVALLCQPNVMSPWLGSRSQRLTGSSAFRSSWMWEMEE